MVGNVLGNRYRILREIGAGGMAKVYLAEDITGNELVAAKVLYPQFSEDIGFVQRFTREAKLASTLTDPHIVRVLDYGADRDLQYLIMEYVEGRDLTAVLKENDNLEWKYALEILDQLATALEHADSHGIVHRDIKPQNLMLNDSGLLKVLDFGIARIPTLPSLTQSGFIGSPYYASPEQAMGEAVDIRSDIYSAGIVLYEMLSGHIPFDAKSPWSIISQHITSEPPPIELPGREIPQNVIKLLERMLAKRPDKRFKSPFELRQAIATVFAGQPIPEDTQDLGSSSQVDKAPMIESLIRRANEAMAAQESARAADLLRQVTKLDPTNKEIAAILKDVEAEARVDALYKSGIRALENDRWAEAVENFSVVARLSPAYKNTDELLTRAQDVLRQENAEKFVDTRYTEGVTYFEAEQWERAIDAFQEVQQLSPGYEHVEHFLRKAELHSNPGLLQKLSQIFRTTEAKDLWRWGLVTVGIVAIIFLSFIIFADSNQAFGNDDVTQRLKSLYEEVQLALEQENPEVALAKLDQILSENPDYADAAEIRRELLATSTPTSSLDAGPLGNLLRQSQEVVEAGMWSEAIEKLTQLRAEDPEFQKALVTSLLCDAYVGRGLETLATVESENNTVAVVSEALADFEAGTEVCPRRTDLADQSKRATAYLEALDTPRSDYETLISTLNPIVAADPDYANRAAKEMLYNAYLDRANIRKDSPEMVAAALGDYEAALALKVDNPSEAQTQRAELLLSFSQRSLQPTSEPTEEAGREERSTSTPDSEPSSVSNPGSFKYRAPQLLSPPNDAIFAGQFAEVVLEWEAIPLAENEYYDVTIMHLFAGEPQYIGSRSTRENQAKLQSDIGVGQAGNDRFYWWVTIRRENSTGDIAISPRSEAKTFIWSR